MRLAPASVILVVLTAACGDAGPGPATSRVLSCAYAGETCETHTGLMTDDVAGALQFKCVHASGAFSDGACPTSGALAGHCRYTGDAYQAAMGLSYPGATLDEYFDASSWTEGSAQAWCAAEPGGAWIP